MADTVDIATRSRNMSRIRNKNTKPELLVRKYLHSKGFRYRLYDKKLPGHPDLVLKKHNAVIFVHGCFWHRHTGCRLAYTPKTKVEFWNKKFSDNTRRDANVKNQLKEQGWRILVIWECATRSKDAAFYLQQVEEWLLSDMNNADIGED